MSDKNYLRKGVGIKLFAFLFILIEISACSKAEKARNPEKPPTVNESTDSNPLEKITFTVDANGNVRTNTVEGTSVEECSLDPKSPDRCSFFGKEIKIEQLEIFYFMRYKGSDCVVFGRATKAKLSCYPPKTP